jgi:hypothetical protein
VLASRSRLCYRSRRLHFRVWFPVHPSTPLAMVRAGFCFCGTPRTPALRSFARMTVGMIIRLPGGKAVLGCDGRLTDVDTSAIITDTLPKYLHGGTQRAPLLACYAGGAGGVWSDLRNTPPRSIAELVRRTELSDPRGREFEWLAYQGGATWYGGTDGVCIEVATMYTIGSGGVLARGALLVSKWTDAQSAGRAVERALKLACRFDSSCGGRLSIWCADGRKIYSVR